MPTSLIFRRVAAVMLTVGLLHMPAGVAAAPDAAQSVGQRGLPERVAFNGNETFSDRALRKALHRSHAYLKAAHPEAPFSAFLQALESTITRGYLKAGFPDVEVTVRQDDEAPEAGVAVQVEEGRRFVNGPLVIKGANPGLHAAIERRLRQGASFEPSVPETKKEQPPPGQPQQEAKAGHLIDILPSRGKEPQPVWPSGGYTAFHDGHQSKINLHVQRALSDQGYFFAETEVELKPDYGTGTTTLSIHIADSGPAAELRNIDVKGLSGEVEDKRKAVMAILDLEPGEPFDYPKLEAARKRLYLSARFTEFRVTPNRVSPDSAQVDLAVELKEYPRAQPLGTALTPAQQFLLKGIVWLNGWPGREEDLVLTVSDEEDTELARVAFSPKHGMVGVLRVPARQLKEWGLLPEVQGSEPLPNEETTCILWIGPERSGLCLPDTGQHLSLTKPPNSTLWMKISPPDKPDDRFEFSFGAGSGGGSGGKKKPFELSIDIHPLTLYKVGDLQFSRENGTGVFTQDKEGQAQRLRLDEQGRLLELLYRQDDKMTVLLKTEPSAYQRLLDSANDLARQVPNSYDPQHPVRSVLPALASWLKTLAPRLGELDTRKQEGASSRLTAEQIEQIAATLEFLAQPALLAPLDRILSEAHREEPDEEYFAIPARPDETPPPNIMLLLMADMVHGPVVELLPDTSWPVKLTREAMHIALGHTPYSGPVLESMYRDNSGIGPVGYLCISAIMKFLNPALSPRFAGRGLGGLTAADFEKDWSLLIPEDEDQRQGLKDLLASFAELTPEEQEAMGLLNPETSPWFADFIKRLNWEDPSSLRSILAPAMADLWNKKLRVHLEKELTLAAGAAVSDSALIAATVNGVPIEWMTIDLMVAAEAVRAGRQDPAWANRKAQEVHQALILQELVYQDYKRTHPDELQALKEELVGQFVEREVDGREDQVPAFLNARGMTRQQLEKALLMDHLIAQRQKDTPEPTEEDARAYYEKNQGSFHVPRKSVHLHMISAPLTSVAPARDQAAQKAHFEAMRKDLLDGADWDEMAKAHSKGPQASKGGCCGTVAVEDLAEPFRAVVETIDDKQTSEVVEHGGSFHLLQVINRAEAGTKSFDDVREAIHRKLLQAKQQEAIQAWIKDLATRVDVVTYKRIQAKQRPAGTAPNHAP